MDRIRRLVWDLDAEFLQLGQNRDDVLELRILTSSIAMTTSTVSKLSSPRSFAKCEVGDNYVVSMPGTVHGITVAYYLRRIGNLQNMLVEAL